ncbi:E3 ubiquitin-protein ligase TRIM7-like isoform X2 [Heteronotia binoei]|uniref:E3 ubiquitin-protein ligase TRIM7-like isoform X2 n=1 Tax=Heteronotia binoei TaxID=13085 RepID=UPI00292D61AC|nr:E3 ubiquitin-protein ligase TRIM7-like isoform X2 [Heteronotia binoei]
MASGSPWTRLQEEATCSICWKYYNNPSILDCGHSFCAACISQCWKEFPDHTVCPKCRITVERKNCRLNTRLANVVEIAKQLSSQVKEGGERSKVCEKHPSRTVFCVPDQIIFCQMCEGSEQHRDHPVASVEGASKMYEDCYSGYIKLLKKKRADIVKDRFCILEWSETLKKKFIIEQQTIAAEFKNLHDFLRNQENHLLKYLKSMSREITDKKNCDLAHLCLDFFTVENNIRLMEEKVSQPGLEFLRVRLCQMRKRLPTVENISVLLKWGFWELTEISAVVKGVASYFTDFLQHACSVEKASVTLDRTSNHPQLLVSPNGKSVKWRPVAAQHPTLHRRFNMLSWVLGCQEFTVGCHHWDVIVKGRGEWAVGVAKSSVRRKGFFHLYATEGVFVVGKLDQYRIINIPQSPFLQLDGELRWIRVYLNCSGGQVNFYDVARATRIHGFTEISCFQETFLPFFYLKGQAQLTLIE